jgi:hypothetical protein
MCPMYQRPEGPVRCTKKADGTILDRHSFGPENTLAGRERPSRVCDTLVVDRSLGGHTVADTLRAAGEDVRAHDGLFAQDTDDEL